MVTAMTPATARQISLIRHQHLVFYVGLWLWLAIFRVSDLKFGIWSQYLHALLHVAACIWPALVFAYFKPFLQDRVSGKMYLVYWALCFLVLVPLSGLLWNAPGYAAVFWVWGLELVLGANEYFSRKGKHMKWLKKIGLESAVLTTIVFIALMLSVMAVSSLNNPKYHSEERLLIGFEFDLPKLAANFITFLGFFVQFLLMYLAGYLLFIVNSRVLVPVMLKTNGLLVYTLSLLTAVAVLYPVLAQLLSVLPLYKLFGSELFMRNPFDLENAASAIGIILLSLPVIVSLHWVKQSHRVLLLEKEKSQAELGLLKQQLNPHFFFNTLNNLYALSLKKSDQTAESILRLSDLMRYTIYKGQEKTVNIDQEVKYLDDYIDLQRIRLKQSLSFSFEKNIGHGQNMEVAPMLLIVLVENAFKHGIEPAESSALLRLSLDVGDTGLNFVCENSVEADEAHMAKGIGLDNLRKRLNLLYPDAHRLTTSVENNLFRAELYVKIG